MVLTLILLAATSSACPSSGSPLTRNTSALLSSQSLNSSLRASIDSTHVSDDTRTTPDIVWSCIATIFACAWVAVHPNLPNPRDSKWAQFKNRVGVMIVALFAPEFILICALRQRIAAEEIMKVYNREIFPGEDYPLGAPVMPKIAKWFRKPSSPPHARRYCTFAHGFYAQMGGFVFCNDEREWPVGILKFEDLLDLIKMGTIDPPQVSEEDIWDKSKGDFLTKSLVLLQTTWFMVQCFVRWAMKLPVTELEVMTLAFAVLNIIIYILWWEKPLNVDVGICIREKKVLRRETWAHSEVDTVGEEEEDITDYSPMPESEGLRPSWAPGAARCDTDGENLEEAREYHIVDKQE